MRWLVDGMNVIGSRPDGWWRDRTAAMRRLCAELDAFAVRTGDEVLVVFDGAPRVLGEHQHVDVRFARRRGRDAADDDLANLAAPGRTLVTSDDALAARARSAGAAVLGARAFRSALARTDAQ